MTGGPSPLLGPTAALCLEESTDHRSTGSSRVSSWAVALCSGLYLFRLHLPHSSFMVLLLSREIRLAPGCVKLERSRNIQKQLERSLLYDESLGLKNSKLTSLLESAETLWRSTIKPLHYQTTVSSTLRSTQYAFLSKSSECLTLSNG